MFHVKHLSNQKTTHNKYIDFSGIVVDVGFLPQNLLGKFNESWFLPFKV